MLLTVTQLSAVKPLGQSLSGDGGRICDDWRRGVVVIRTGRLPISRLVVHQVHHGEVRSVQAVSIVAESLRRQLGVTEGAQ